MGIERKKNEIVWESARMFAKVNWCVPRRAKITKSNGKKYFMEMATDTWSHSCVSSRGSDRVASLNWASNPNNLTMWTWCRCRQHSCASRMKRINRMASSTNIIFHIASITPICDCIVLLQTLVSTQHVDDASFWMLLNWMRTNVTNSERILTEIQGTKVKNYCSRSPLDGTGIEWIWTILSSVRWNWRKHLRKTTNTENISKFHVFLQIIQVDWWMRTYPIPNHIQSGVFANSNCIQTNTYIFLLPEKSSNFRPWNLYFYSNGEYNEILLFRGIITPISILYQFGVGHLVRHFETWSVNALNGVCNRRQTTLWLRHYVHRSCNEPFSSLRWPLANVRTGMSTEYSISISRPNWTSSVARFVASNLSFHWRIMGNARRRRRTFTTTSSQSINIY